MIRIRFVYFPNEFWCGQSIEEYFGDQHFWFPDFYEVKHDFSGTPLKLNRKKRPLGLTACVITMFSLSSLCYFFPPLVFLKNSSPVLKLCSDISRKICNFCAVVIDQQWLLWENACCCVCTAHPAWCGGAHAGLTEISYGCIFQLFK